MKRIMTLLLIMATVMQMVSAKSLGRLIEDYRYQKNAEYFHVTPLLMKMARTAMGHKAQSSEEGRLVRKIKSIRTLDLEECSADVKRRFSTDVQKLEMNDYEPLVTSCDDGETVKIMMKAKGDVIRELVIICSDCNDCALMWVNCKVKKDEIQSLVDMQTKQRNNHSKKKKSAKPADFTTLNVKDNGCVTVQDTVSPTQ